MNPQERKAIPMTESDKANPISKYYSEQTAQPAPQVMGALFGAGPMDPSLAMAPQDCGKLLDPANLVNQTGYCIMENGAGYSTVQTTMPGVTLEMIQWFFSWMPLEQIRYKIWEPYSHMSIAVADHHREKLEDPSISYADKCKDVIHFAVNVTPMGERNVISHYEGGEPFGIKEEDLKDAIAIGGFRINSPRSPKHGNYNKACSAFLYYCRAVEGGVEVISKEWQGYRINHGVADFRLPAQVTLPVEAAMGPAIALAMEFANLGALLPKLYEEYGK